MAGSLGLNVNDAKNQNISPLDKTSEEVRKAVSKHLQGQAVEALQQQTPKDVIAMINKLLPSEQQAAPAAGGTAIGQPPQTQTPEALPAISPQEQVQQVLGQLANFQSQQAQPQTSPEAQALTGSIQQQPQQQVDDRGKVEKFFNALGITQSSATRLRTAQAKALEQELAGGGKKAIAKDLAESKLSIETFKQDRLDQREVLKSQLKDSGVDDTTAGLNLLSTDVANLAQARREVFARGRVTGKFGGLVAAFGPQRTKRAVAESFAETLLFSFGEHIIKQKGRAFIGEEQARVKKNVIGAFLSETESVFDARMNAILTQANTRLPKGSTPIPDLETLLKKLAPSPKSPTSQTFKSGQTGTALGIGFTVE